MSTINKQTPIITLSASLFPQQHVESETLPPLSSDKAAFLQLGHLGFYAFLRKEDDGKYDGWSLSAASGISDNIYAQVVQPQQGPAWAGYGGNSGHGGSHRKETDATLFELLSSTLRTPASWHGGGSLILRCPHALTGNTGCSVRFLKTYQVSSDPRMF